MKIDGYIIDSGSWDTLRTYTAATIQKTTKTTITVLDEHGQTRVFNLRKEYGGSHLPPTIGQRLDERGKGSQWRSPPWFDIDVETVSKEKEQAEAAQARREAWRVAAVDIEHFLSIHRHNGIEEGPLTIIQRMAAHLKDPEINSQP